MGLKLNPLTAQFDLVGSGGGGGSSYIDGEVQNFSALPQTLGSPAVDSAYLVREAEGAWLLNRKPAGIYIRTANTGTRASDWTYAGEFPDVFSDDKFVLYDETDSSKNLVFQLSGITTGTTRTLTAPNASGTIALTSDITGGGTKTCAVFTAEHNQPPSTAFATLDTRNSIAVLDFDAATDENAVFVGIMPEGASLGSGLIVRLHWMATSATSGNVRWGVQFERSNTDLDSDSFAAVVEANGAANGTSGILTTTAITVTDFDGITAGDVFRLRVSRNADDATNDTMTGDAELVAVEVRSAA